MMRSTLFALAFLLISALALAPLLAPSPVEAGESCVWGSVDCCMLGGIAEGDIYLNETYKLITDADGDSYIWSDADDAIRIVTGGATRLSISNAAFTYQGGGPVNIAGSSLYSSTGAASFSSSSCTPGQVADAAGNWCFTGDAEFQGDVVQYGSNGQTAILEIPTCETLTFAANPGDAAKTWTSAAADGALLDAVVSRVLVQGTNCTSFDIGDGSDQDIFANDVALTVGTTTTNADATASFANPIGVNASADLNIVLTANGGNCYDLSVRVCAAYRTYGAPAN
jgi:hypothetical protein